MWRICDSRASLVGRDTCERRMSDSVNYIRTTSVKQQRANETEAQDTFAPVDVPY